MITACFLTRYLFSEVTGGIKSNIFKWAYSRRSLATKTCQSGEDQGEDQEIRRPQSVLLRLTTDNDNTQMWYKWVHQKGGKSASHWKEQGHRSDERQT